MTEPALPATILQAMESTFTKPELRKQFAYDIDALIDDFVRLRHTYGSLGAADAEAVWRVCLPDLLSPEIPDLLRRWSRKTWERLYEPGPKEWGPRKFRRGAPDGTPLRPIPDCFDNAAKRFLLALQAVHVGLRDLDDIWTRLDADERRAASSGYPFAFPAEEFVRRTAVVHTRVITHFWSRCG